MHSPTEAIAHRDPSTPIATPLTEEASATKGDVLFISRQRIVGRTNGSSTYLLDIASAVRRAGFTPHLLQPSPNLMGRWPAMRLRSDMQVFETHAIRGVLRIGSWVVSRDVGVWMDALRGTMARLAKRIGLQGTWLNDRPRPYSIAAPWTSSDLDYVRKQGKGKGKADIVIADYAFQAEALALFPQAPSAIVMHDLFHSRDTLAAGRDSVAQIDRHNENRLLSRANAIIAIQAAEAHYVADHIPETRAILAPMAAHPVPSAQPGFAKELLFVGSNTAPNVVGLQWFLTEIWPRVSKTMSGFRLNVAGSIASAFPKGGPTGVTFHGMVGDLSPLYTSAGIVISPLTFGSGLKIKLIEAMAHGKAMVATSVTLQGVERQCSDAVLEADDPDQFAKAILSLAADDALRRRLAEAALSTAQRHFSADACYAELTAWLEETRPDASVAQYAEPGA